MSMFGWELAISFYLLSIIGPLHNMPNYAIIRLALHMTHWTLIKSHALELSKAYLYL